MFRLITASGEKLIFIVYAQSTSRLMDFRCVDLALMAAARVGTFLMENLIIKNVVAAGYAKCSFYLLAVSYCVFTVGINFIPAAVFSF